MRVLATHIPVSPPLVLATAILGLLVVVTIGLWAWYGTAVFFEVIRAGWMACF